MDDVFQEVASLLFGDGASDVVHKANPDGADLSSTRKRQRKEAQIGLVSNYVGIGAGVAGTGAALRDDRFARGGKFSRMLHANAKKIPAPISSKGGKTGAVLAGGALGLQLGNIAGDAVANRVLARSAHDPKKKKVVKRAGGILTAMGVVTGGTALGAGLGYQSGQTHAALRDQLKKDSAAAFAGGPPTKGKIVAIGAKKAEPKIKGQFQKLNSQAVAKSEPQIEISKVDEDKRQIFGWASVVEKNGEPVVDLQGDFIPVEEMEKASYAYVRKSRKQGDMHARNGSDAKVVGEMIESFAVTPEKKAALGLPDEMPIGWWVGFQVEDPEVWADIKSGKRTGFSVHGAGVRTPA